MASVKVMGVSKCALGLLVVFFPLRLCTNTDTANELRRDHSSPVSGLRLGLVSCGTLGKGLFCHSVKFSLIKMGAVPLRPNDKKSKH